MTSEDADRILKPARILAERHAATHVHRTVGLDEFYEWLDELLEQFDRDTIVSSIAAAFLVLLNAERANVQYLYGGEFNVWTLIDPASIDRAWAHDVATALAAADLHRDLSTRDDDSFDHIISIAVERIFDDFERHASLLRSTTNELAGALVACERLASIVRRYLHPDEFAAVIERAQAEAVQFSQQAEEN